MEIEKEIAYWCKTEKLAKEFLSECDKQGINWFGGDLASSHTNYEYHGEGTCYLVASCNLLSFGRKYFFKNDGYEIIEYRCSSLE